MLMKTNPALKLYDESDSGNIVHILSELTGECEPGIEQLLQTGITPWDLAKRFGVLGQLRDSLLERIFTNLNYMVQNGQISRQYADELIAYFEMNVPAEDTI